MVAQIIKPDIEEYFGPSFRPIPFQEVWLLYYMEWNMVGSAGVSHLRVMIHPAILWYGRVLILISLL